MPRLTDRRRAAASAVLAGVAAATLTLAPGPAPAAVKPRHELTATAEQIGDEGASAFRTVGAVPTYKGRKLSLQLNLDGGGWRFWKYVVTSAEDGTFSERIYGGKRGTKACYKVVVPSTKKYRTTKTRIGCIVTK